MGMTDQEVEYKIELHNHTNFYQKQKDVAIRLEERILERFYNTNDETDFDVMVREECKKEVLKLIEAESMNRPNKPGYYRANND